MSFRTKRSYASTPMSQMSTERLIKKARGYQKAKSIVRGAIKKSKKKMDELKYVDIASATYVADTTGTVTLLNGIATGDDNTTRDGRQVTIKSVQVRGLVQQTDQITANTRARIILVWDNAANGALASVTDILTAANSASFPKVDNAYRFTILLDKSFAVAGNNNTATQAYSSGQGVYCVDLYKSLGVITQYGGSTNGIASIQNGALLMVTVGDTTSLNGATFQVATRVRFTE